MKQKLLLIIIIANSFNECIVYSQSTDSIRKSFYSSANKYPIEFSDKLTLNIKKTMKSDTSFRCEASYYLAEIYRSKNRINKAINFYKDCLECNFSDSATIYSLMAQTFVNVNDYEGSLKYYLNALDIRPNSGQLNYNYAHALSKTENFNLSIFYYNKALENGYREDWVYRGLYQSKNLNNESDLEIKKSCLNSIREYGDNVMSYYYLVKIDFENDVFNSETAKFYEKLKIMDEERQLIKDFDLDKFK